MGRAMAQTAARQFFQNMLPDCNASIEAIAPVSTATHTVNVSTVQFSTHCDQI
jgi:hypothetical protein